MHHVSVPLGATVTVLVFQTSHTQQEAEDILAVFLLFSAAFENSLERQSTAHLVYSQLCQKKYLGLF